MKRIFPAFLTLFTAAECFAGVTMPALFSDDMVLQRDAKVRVWGWASPGEEVRVVIDDQRWLTNADQRGDWTVTLGAHKAGGPYRMVVVGNDQRVYENVMFGDVWVCSGQSNMEWPVAQANDAEKEIASANYANVRLFQVPKTSGESPLATVGGLWEQCSPETVARFSAVGYFFGRELATKTGVAIGLINSSWGGTPVESWTSRGALRRVPRTSRQLDDHLARTADPKLMAGATAIQRNPAWHPGALYNGMVAPLTNYAIRGAIWYQGESNAGDPALYSTTFPNMVRDWRKAWGQGEFPFYFVQLANFVGNAGWPGLREAQLRTLDLPNTGMAVTIDIGSTNDIHPRNKQEVGRRLALWALRDVFGHKVVVSGPLYSGMATRGSQIELSFDYAEGLKSRDGGPLVGFQIAGADGIFVDAQAVIKDGKVVVSGAGVHLPMAARYAWASDPKQNLVNGVGLPASPFRTDVPGDAGASPSPMGRQCAR